MSKTDWLAMKTPHLQILQLKGLEHLQLWRKRKNRRRIDQIYYCPTAAAKMFHRAAIASSSRALFRSSLALRRSCPGGVGSAFEILASSPTNTIRRTCNKKNSLSHGHLRLRSFHSSTSEILTSSPTNTSRRTHNKENSVSHGHLRSFHSSTSDLEGDLDDLCKKHMELPADQFARGCSFLHQVALGNAKEVDSLTRKYPHLVNFRDYDRRTSLHIAASEGHLGICQLLVERGARINRSDRWGGSPLDDSFRHRHLDVLEFLRSCGGTFGSSSQATNFIAAASEGDIEEVQALLNMGNFDVNAADYDKRTALHLAAGEGHAKIVELLCQAGANANAMDRWNNRPLDDAQLNDQSECARILEKYGAKHGSSDVSSMGKEALLDVMEQYGKVRDGVLSLDWHDVSALLAGVGENPTDAVVRKMFEVADRDGDGLIDQLEFFSNSDLFLQGRPARIILVVGGPGSGKGLLSERLVKECGVVHLSSGDLLRQEVEAGTELGKQVDEIMKAGGLVSSAIMVALMQKRMKDHPGKRILLDGFPRSAENARDLVTLCGKPELALHLDCDDTILIERILARGKSGARADDNIQTALQRIRTYHKYHHVTLDFLKEEHVPVVNLDCAATPDGVWEQLSAVGRLMRKPIGRKVEGNGDSKQKDDGFPIPA